MTLTIHRRLRTALKASLLIAVLASTACVYRVPIQQGNLLENKDIEQIKVGMTESQVRYVLGTPMVIDAFTKNRWDYVYYLRKGRKQTVEQRHLIVYFDNGVVSKLEEVADKAG